MKRFLLAIVASIALVSCSERDASDIVVFFTQSADTVNVGAKVDFLVQAFTIHEKITKVSFASFDETFGFTDLGFIEPDAASWQDHFYYEAPSLAADTAKVRIKFIVDDNLGHSVTEEARLVVISKDRPLEDHSGLTVHSASYGSDDGFCLKTRQIISSLTADDSEKDILLADDGSVSTATDVVFSLVPSFNYPEATRKSVENTFNALNKTISLSALKVDDVFLVGRKDLETGAMTPWGVFKVMAVYEEGGGVRLVLNYKFI
ncbi:MAG: hypothetical protein IK045_07170 [Bacteroidales bacterium]|nr:hypothetical protein [Bacteroidales bacterium]